MQSFIQTDAPISKSIYNVSLHTDIGSLICLYETTGGTLTQHSLDDFFADVRRADSIANVAMGKYIVIYNMTQPVDGVLPFLFQVVNKFYKTLTPTKTIIICASDHPLRGVVNFVAKCLGRPHLVVNTSAEGWAHVQYVLRKTK